MLNIQKLVRYLQPPQPDSFVWIVEKKYHGILQNHVAGNATGELNKIRVCLDIEVIICEIRCVDTLVWSAYVAYSHIHCIY